jgi:hypothetical protein
MSEKWIDELEEDEEFWERFAEQECGGQTPPEDIKAIVYWVAGRYAVHPIGEKGRDLRPAELVAEITKHSGASIRATVRRVWGGWPEECRLPA